jgi:hypothetical protein
MIFDGYGLINYHDNTAKGSFKDIVIFISVFDKNKKRKSAK